MDQRLHDLHAYWAGLRGGRFAPSRDRIQPADIPHLLPHLFLMDVEDGPDGLRARYRLIGTVLDRLFGRRLTGVELSEAWSGREREALQDLATLVVRERASLLASCEFRSPAGRPLRAQMIVLPLSTDGEQVDKLFGAFVTLPDRPWEGLELQGSLSTLSIHRLG